MSRTSNSSNALPSFLTKLSTLREFVKGMGVNASEEELSDALKNSGYQVELALERILTGNFGGGGGDGATATTAMTMGSTPFSSTTMKRGRSSLSSSLSLSKTPKSSSKRQKLRGSVQGNGSRSGSATKNTQEQHHQNQYQQRKNPTGKRLLLCKRWTVACSKSTRGQVSYGEALDFTENWKNHLSHAVPAVHKKANHGTAKRNVVDPMVRFRSRSDVEGTLDRRLCSILSPLLRLPADDVGTDSDSRDFAPLVAIEGETLMEDRALVIGSEIPISLQVYVNDPVGFFGLFRRRGSEDGGMTSSELFVRKKRGKEVNTKFSGEDPAEAAFRLLQWAEMGEDFSLLERKNVSRKLNSGVDGDDDDDDNAMVDKRTNAKNGKSEHGCDEGIDDASASSCKGVDSNGSEEEDFIENSLPSEEANELNQLVVSAEGREGGARANETVPCRPELSDPEGFKSGVALRPYQRQALHWMCRREGCSIVTKGEDDDADEVDSETDLLAELAASATLSSDARESQMQVWGGGEGARVSCDCGPVVVSDELVASNAIPVIDYDQMVQRNEEDKGNSTGRRRTAHHHPLWKRRYLVTADLKSVFAFYVNELLGIASASPPNPPRQCVGGILADAMGLGKTVMLLSLILKTNELEGDARGLSSSHRSERVANRKNGAASKDGVVDLLSDVESDSNIHEDDDDESYIGDISMNKPSLDGDFKSNGTTLVIAPLSLISQWEEEMATKTNLSHLVYYDSTKKGTGSDAFDCIDVVVTTYGTIQSEYVSLSRLTKAKGGGPMDPNHNHPLLNCRWKRIILDEAHGIKNPGTVVSKACCMLEADARWCVTGTPVQNSLQDVYGLLKFLRHEPWCEPSFWKNTISNSLTRAGCGGGGGGGGGEEDNNTTTKNAEEEEETSSQQLSVVFGRVRRVLAPIILRRTKDTLAEDGTPILTLPPIESSTVRVTMSPPEREFYNALLERSQSVFEGFLNAGTASKSWFAIFSLLQRLRQSCDHISLTVNKKIESTSGEEAHYLKDKHEITSDESPKNDGGVGTVDDSFLSDLISKFTKKTTNNAVANAQQEESTSFAKKVAESLSQCVSSEEYLKSECPICFEEPRVEDAVHTPCAHMFCKDCLLSELQEQSTRSNKNLVNLHLFKKAGVSNQHKVEGGLCPVCQDYVKISAIIQINKSENGEMISKYLNQSSAEFEKENMPNTSAVSEALPSRDAVARETLESALNGAGSSKLDTVLTELDRVWTSDPGSKVLIFSQYLGFLDIVGRALKDIRVPCFRIDGKMSLKERVAMIDKFNKKKTTDTGSGGVHLVGSVFLLSMKAGGVGLNLVAASSVFILDPWWNQAIEDQCINRIHRIGQQAKIVRVRKFVVTDSVEEKIVNLQGKKKGMANEILSDVDSGGPLDSSKPTLEDFKLLFGR